MSTAEVNLFTNQRDKERMEQLSELYSLIVAIDSLERLFIRDIVPQQEYTQTCSRLLGQYSTLLKNRQLETDLVDIDTFVSKYRLECASGVQRIKVGIPATIEIAPMDTGNSGVNSSNSTPQPPNVSARAVAEITSLFITVMDGLKLNFRAKDQLHPLFSELVTGLNKVITTDFEGRGKLIEWLVTLNRMKIDEELSDEQARQCLFDLDVAFKSYYSTLQ